MKVSKILVLCLVLFVAACEWKTDREKNTLVKHRVYVIDVKKDSTNMSAKRTPVFADTSYLESIFRNSNLVNIHDLDSTIQVRLSYSDTINFLHTNLYDGLRKGYLHCEAAIKLANAQAFLKKMYPNYSLVVFDATRPLHIQKMMWDSLKMPDLKKYQYLSPPSEPSLHNYGCAVDVSIMNMQTDSLLDMGTGHDTFTKLAEPGMEKYFLKSGDLSPEVYANRLLLRKIMQRAGYNPITTEWWHFSICTKPEAVKRFQLVY